MPLPSAAASTRFLLLGGALVLASACGQAPGSAPKGPAPDDAVNVGYGTLDRRELTGAVSSLTEEDIQNIRVSRVEELLESRAAGVHVIRMPSGDYSIRIRGSRSLIGSNEPLVVLDGVPLQSIGLTSALSSLSPHDIARIDVLKDAGSTAAYGSRGANGVIIISTRRVR